MTGKKAPKAVTAPATVKNKEGIKDKDKSDKAPWAA